MACPAVLTGQRFVATTIAHLDCQAQAIGSYGFGALAQPGSPVTLALTSLLTIFVALFGVRLLVGENMNGRDLSADVLRAGIVLTLATSWPAWRIVGYDLIINGPQDIARAIGLAAQLPGSDGDLANRLQRSDEGLAALNVFGSGRLGVAAGDWFQLGFARSAFLIGTLGPLAFVRLVTGILLAIAPLMAGFLLFGITRSVFVGWAKGLVATFLSSVAITLILESELALLEPWLLDVLQLRTATQRTLDAPVEILVVTLVFAVVSVLSLAMMTRIALHPSFHVSVLTNLVSRHRPPSKTDRQADVRIGSEGEPPSRAYALAQSVSETIRRENRLAGGSELAAVRDGAGKPASASDGIRNSQSSADLLGNSFRRGSRRVSASGERRDTVS